MIKKMAFALITAATTCLSSAIYETNTGYTFSIGSLTYDHFYLNLWTPSWQPRSYYSGVTSSSIGYFYVNSWDGSISVYGSNRYVLSDDINAFYESLLPLKDNLLPYATPNASKAISLTVLSEEMTTISNLPAKKVVVELSFADGQQEIVASYIFTKQISGIFSSSLYGFTYSVSCAKIDYYKGKDNINDIFSKLEIY